MKKIINGLLILCLLAPVLMQADGMILPPPNKYVKETDQKAVIFHEAKTNTETMVVSVSYQGDTKDFAWVIPVPSEPEVERGSKELFSKLAKLTNSYNTYAPVFDDDKLQATGDEALESVEVILEKTIDYYDVTVLKSTDEDALANWLNDNGYDYPEDYAYILNEYINNEWYFVALKITDSALDSANLKGSTTPIQLTFSSEHIVYPMRISSIIEDASDDDNTELIFNETQNISQPILNKSSNVTLNVYVIADHKKNISQLTAVYADKIKDNVIEDLATLSNGDSWIKPEKGKYYLTKFTGAMSHEQMTEDLFFKDADDNEKVGTSSIYSYNDFSWDKLAKLVLFILLFITAFSILVIFSPLGIVYIVFTIIKFKTKKQSLKITSQVIQWINSFLFIVAIIALQIIVVKDGAYEGFEHFWGNYNYPGNAAVISGWFVAIIVLVLIIILNLKSNKIKNKI